MGTDNDPDETFTLRLALIKKNLFAFMLMWENFSHLFDDRHLLTVARFIVH